MPKKMMLSITLQKRAIQIEKCNYVCIVVLFLKKAKLIMPSNHDTPLEY